MTRIWHQAAQTIIVISFICILALGLWMSTWYPYNQIAEKLNADGYTDVEVTTAWFNRAPIQCSGKHTTLAKYSAVRRGRAVTGFACYRGWIWGVAYWDN